MNTKVAKRFLFAAGGLTLLLLGMIIFKPLIHNYQEAHRYDFFLDTVDGPVSLGMYKGKSLALYFGYTYCPDVCPTSLSALADAMDTLSASEQASFQGLFVSVDPKRDTLEHLKSYALYFHDNFKGATSKSIDYLHRLVKNYGGSFRYLNLEGSDMGYSVNHTSDIYLFDKEGTFKGTIPHLSSQEAIVTALKKAL